MKPARERILATADELFYREGVRAVGVDRIVLEAGVAKATLYSHFRAKDILIAEWLMSRHASWMTWLENDVERRGGGVLRVFDVLRDWFASPDFRGCAFINSQAELGRSSPLVASVITGHKRALKEYIERQLGCARAVAGAELAAELLLLVEGAIVTATIERDPSAADVARRAASRLLAATRSPR